MNRNHPKHLEISSDDLYARCMVCNKHIEYQKGQKLDEYRTLFYGFLKRHKGCSPEKEKK